MPSSPSPKALDPQANIARFPIERVSDAELVQAAARGDSRAISVIWERHAAAVRRVLRGALGPDSAIEDLLQEVFIALLRGVSRIEQGCALRAYLTGVAVRQAALELRRRKVRRWVTLTPTGQLPDVPTRARDSEGREALFALYRVLEKMGTRERLAFALRHIEGMEILEVARSLGASESTVRRALATARNKIERSVKHEPALECYLSKGTEAQP
ncbi:MAG TPA: sigma-70 family RNA polymerase sigma factor [Polyangiaceae bacterium]|nr:sigma-70 family RNA polymerase sigma factor [Polyangiaceae bacterium]